jgi:hypothetical protein
METSGATDAVGPAPQAVVVEIFGDETDPTCWSILLSVTPPTAHPAILHCVFGFSNDPAECDRLATLGLPVVEGKITFAQRNLSVDTAVYPPRVAGAASTMKITRLLEIQNIDLDPTASKPAGAKEPEFNPVYRTRQAVPDLACPDSEMVGREVDIRPIRWDEHSVQVGATIVDFRPVLYPDLSVLFESTPQPAAMWTGRFGKWEAFPQKTVTRFRRTSVFGPPSFVFDDVEIVGFRTELPSASRLTDLRPADRIIAPLNFHLSDRNAPVDFRYEAATTTVIIEMLRYGKMRAPHAQKPFTSDDSMAQHELLARLVVGRVDDDTAQARDAAVFVPTIFVDNPWSKAVGRQLQGFPKVLAEFRAGSTALMMDDATRLHEVTEVRLANRAGADTAPKDAILTIDCPDASDGSAQEFEGPPLTSLFDTTLSRRAPWEQFDFDEAEFRRAFARTIVGYQFSGFRVIQVSPVVDGIKLPKAWVSGRCTVSNLQVAFPTGVATLQFNIPDSSPPEWQALVTHLLEKSGRMAFTTGDWYRVRCSMELQFDDGLEW